MAAMFYEGTRAPMTFFLMQLAPFRRLFEWNWGRRMPFKRGGRLLPEKIEGMNQADAAKIKAASGLPVFCVGGWQTASRIRDALQAGHCDVVSIARGLLANPDIEPQLLVNLADSANQAREIIGRVQQTAQTFLHVGVGSAGYIPRDAVVSQSIVRRLPFLLECAGSPASRAIDQLARRVVNFTHRQPSITPYFTKIRTSTTAREAA